MVSVGARLGRAGSWVRSGQAWLPGLAAAGVLLELSLVVGWLGAFSIAGHPGFPSPGQDPLVWLLGDGPSGIDHFIVLLLAAFLPYLLALRLAGRTEGPAAVVLALAGSFVFGVTELGLFPAGTTDIFHNMMDGRLLWLYHFNPTTVPPSTVSGDPLFAYLHYWQQTPSAYGPLWFVLTLPAVLAGGSSLMRNIIAFKALSFAFELISLALIVLIVRRIDRRRIAAAVVCFGWNPLVLWETAGNGHNDIVMMAFALLAVLLLLTRHWPLAFFALACSVLVKYVSLVLLPVFILWILYRERRSAVLPLISSLAASAVFALVVFLPFWAGVRTFAQLGARKSQVFLSLASALMGTWGENVPNTPEVVRVERALTLAFVVLYAVALLRLRRGPASLIRVCVEVLFLLLLLMTWWFWPWYVIWGLALAALLPASAHARLFVLFSATAMLIYVSSPWRLSLWNFESPLPMALGTALFVFTTPLLYAAVELLPSAKAIRARHWSDEP